jgi:uncharacterized protein
VKESRYNIWVEREGTRYVYNGVSGALLRMSNEDHRALERFLSGDDEAGFRRELGADLARGRMIVSDDYDELSALAGLYRLSRHDTSQLGLTIVTSLGCNFNCPYCFEAKHPSIMDDSVQAGVLQLLDDQLPRINALQVSWFGGEPLVGRKALINLSDLFIERCDRNEVGYSAMITTNGYLLDEETCCQLRDRRITFAQVSLDGPPEVHDRMRPLANGNGTFWTIVRNLHHAVDYLPISIRVNVDKHNFGRAEELLQILAAEGLSGRLTVNIGQIIGVDDGVPSPSTTYRTPCFTNPEYAQAEVEFGRLAARYGLATPTVPRPVATPCTAVRANELVVGSKGELYKCWESVGNELEVIGHLSEYQDPGGRMQRWLKYDPFANKECQACVALPVCMGGCAHHAMSPVQYENRCGTFRVNHRERVLEFVEAAEQVGSRGLVQSSQLTRPVDTR